MERQLETPAGQVRPAPGAVAAYAAAVVRWRWLVLALSLAGAIAASLGAASLRFEADYRYNFGADNPELAAFDALQNTYTRNDNVLFVIVPATGDVFTRETLAAVLWLTEQGWQIPYSIRVDSVTNFQHTWAEEDDLIVEDLVEEVEGLSGDDLTRVRSIALAEPLLAGKLVAHGGAATSVNVTVQMPDGGGVEPEITAFARGLVAELKTRHPGLEVGLTGFAAMSNAFDETAKHDIANLVPLMYAALLVTMLLFLRSFWGTLATLLVTGLSASSAIGLAGSLGIPLTPPSSVAPTIILTIAIADSVHILVTMAKEMRSGRGKREALVESLRLNWQPVLLTSVTTVVGFLSLNFSDAPPFRDLGNITALGVAAAWIFSVTFLPALIAILPYRVRPERRFAGWSMERFGEWIVAHYRAVLIGTGAIVVSAAALIPRIELNDMFVSYFDPSIEFRRDTDFATEHLAGIYMLHYSLGAGEDDGINQPGYLQQVDAFAEWLRGQPEVTHVSTLTDTMKRLNMNMHGDDRAYYRLPERKDLAAQYLLLYEMSLPYGLDLNNQINVNKSATKLTATVENVSARELREIDARAREWLEQNAPSGMLRESAGAALMFAYISYRNVESMMKGTVLAFALIALILIVSLRSIKLGLLSLIPNLVPTILAFGVWAGAVGEVGLAVAMVTASSLGIIVDATVHFLSKYLRARRERGASAQDGVRYALSTVGGALWITFLVLVAGFSVLALSSFRINSHFGLLVAITIGAALLADFLLLPALLVAIDRAAKPQANG